MQTRVIAAALALPGIALIIATAILLARLPFGADPLWRVEPLTLSEAAALRDAAEVVRLIGRGANPNDAGPVRATFLRNDPVVITPLEAAVASDRADIIEVLVDHGAVLDAPVWQRLICFASALDADDARAALDARRPDAVSPGCEHVATPW